MASRIFNTPKTKKTRQLPKLPPVTQSVQPANVKNQAGGIAYSRTAKEELAQLVMAGFFGDTYYAKAEDQLDRVIELSRQVETEFLAKLALEARREGFMKDTPALLCAVLTTRGDEGRALLTKIFNRVIDNGKMLRNFVQIVRSGKVGRKSLGTHPKNLVRSWFDARDNETVFKNSVGNDPSLADVIKMVRPKPGTPSRSELFAYLIGKEKDKRHLPTIVKAYEKFKSDPTSDVPDVPFEMLTALTLDKAAWKNIALNMTWTQLRMNLNTLLRHGVFEDNSLVDYVAAKLSDKNEVKRTKVFPYQIYTSIKFVDPKVPSRIVDALHDALDASLDNIPDLTGKSVYVFSDVSGSMADPVTGQRDGATTKIRCVDVAALISAALYRKGANVWAFDTDVYELNVSRRDSVATIADKLAAFGGGGTDCSLPLKRLNQRGLHADLVFFTSDNQSWADAQYLGRGTGLRTEFERLRLANPNAKLVCLDINPAFTKQSGESKHILNVGGFSDRVFEVVGDFLEGKVGAGHWVKKIEEVQI